MLTKTPRRHAGEQQQLQGSCFHKSLGLHAFLDMPNLAHFMKETPGFLNPSNTHSKTPRLYSNINQSVQLFASPAHIATFIGPQKGPRKKNRPVQVAPPLSSVCHAQTLPHRRLRPRRRNRERCATGTAHA